MEEYLGETDVTDEFKTWTREDWIVYFIEHYAGFDGEHHKLWLLDQIARILKGTKVIVKRASWAGGTWEYRVSLGEPSKEYLGWVENMKKDGDYDEGVAP